MFKQGVSLNNFSSKLPCYMISFVGVNCGYENLKIFCPSAILRVKKFSKSSK